MSILTPLNLLGSSVVFEEIDGNRLGSDGRLAGGSTDTCVCLSGGHQMGAPMYPVPLRLQASVGDGPRQGRYEEIGWYFRLRDPRHLREDELFNQLGYIDLQFLTPRIKGEIKLFAGLMDTITPPSSYFAAYNRITSPKSHVIYPDFGHEGLPGADDLIWEFFSRL